MFIQNVFHTHNIHEYICISNYKTRFLKIKSSHLYQTLLKMIALIKEHIHKCFIRFITTFAMYMYMLQTASNANRHTCKI